LTGEGAEFVLRGSHARAAYAGDVVKVAKHPRGRPKGRTKAETREQILRAAEACFAVSGYDKATNRQIAEAAGVTAGAIYQHFPSKLDLYIAVHDRTYDIIKDGFKAVAESTVTFREGLLAMFELARRLTDSDPMMARFAVRAPLEARRHPELTKVVGGYTAPVIEIWHEVAQRAVDEGNVACTVDEIAAGIASMISGLTQSAWYNTGPEAWNELIDEFINLIPGEASPS
jgi:AcrR family transcriptional regulator